MNLWNIRDLEPPSKNFCVLENNDLNTKPFNLALTEALNIFTNQLQLDAEAALLSRYIYRLKQKFRNDKGLKEMQKMNVALLRYLKIDYPRAIKSFQEAMPSKEDEVRRYPTLNMLDYLLVRTQGVVKLMLRIAQCAVCGAEYIEGRISIGHLWKYAIIALGISGRLFVIAKSLIKAASEFYARLLGLRKYLKNPGEMWIGNDYVFPGDLEEWLGEDWAKLKECKIKDDIKEQNKNLLRFCEEEGDDSDVEITGEFLEIESDLEITEEYIQISDAKNKPVNDEKNLVSSDEDIGERIVKKRSKPKLQSIIQNISSLPELKLFISREHKTRETNAEKCKLKHLSGMQWNMLYNLLMGLVKKGKKCKKVKQAEKYVLEAKEALLMNVS